MVSKEKIVLGILCLSAAFFGGRCSEIYYSEPKSAYVETINKKDYLITEERGFVNGNWRSGTVMRQSEEDDRVFLKIDYREENKLLKKILKNKERSDLLKKIRESEAKNKN